MIHRIGWMFDDSPAHYECLNSAIIDEVLTAIRGKGFWEAPSFLDNRTCSTLREHLATFISDNPEHVVGSNKGDERIWAAEHVSPVIRAFKEDPFFEELCTRFYGKPSQPLFIMANRLDLRDDRIVRSGGRWHRDRATPQLKAMIYLSDVTDANGPFQMYPYSQVESEAWNDRFELAGLDPADTRWDDEDFEQFELANQAYLKQFTAQAGTLIFFDSSVIHSGKPLVEGTRYALTSYCYEKDKKMVRKARKKWPRAAGPIEWAQ